MVRSRIIGFSLSINTGESGSMFNFGKKAESASEKTPIDCYNEALEMLKIARQELETVAKNHTLQVTELKEELRARGAELEKNKAQLQEYKNSMKLWVSEEYSLEVPQDGKVHKKQMDSANNTIAFITSVQGRFEGSFEKVWIEKENSLWVLCGRTAQPGTKVKARCAGIRLEN